MDIDFIMDRVKNHVATFTDYGNIKILDFKSPNTIEYRIRFLFEEDYYRLHISGDLGELIATNYNNMTYEKFSDFVDNTGYFESKIDCCNRPLYYYDEDDARADLLTYLKDNDYDDSDVRPYSKLEYFVDEVIEDYNNGTGLGSAGYKLLSEYITDAWEIAGDLGKRRSDILELYMLMFKLAQAQLDSKE